MAFNETEAGSPCVLKTLRGAKSFKHVEEIGEWSLETRESLSRQKLKTTSDS